MFRIGFIFFFKHKTAYEMRISDWSSDVCSSDLARDLAPHRHQRAATRVQFRRSHRSGQASLAGRLDAAIGLVHLRGRARWRDRGMVAPRALGKSERVRPQPRLRLQYRPRIRSEEHTSELQSLMRISYAVFCL